ncbi:hypothetical protein BX600DRAFT_76627 [Xylariales sp. PMI_506]|nr:hypothetical protein BX600DRAFT_76627 [Xylariales sp. PMI_506]
MMLLVIASSQQSYEGRLFHLFQLYMPRPGPRWIFGTVLESATCTGRLHYWKAGLCLVSLVQCPTTRNNREHSLTGGALHGRTHPLPSATEPLAEVLTALARIELQLSERRAVEEDPSGRGYGPSWRLSLRCGQCMSSNYPAAETARVFGWFRLSAGKPGRAKGIFGGHGPTWENWETRTLIR